MEPLDEKELSSLLRRWEAPEAPGSLEHRVLPRPLLWWQWLFMGTIRVPVPVGAAALVVMLGLWFFAGRAGSTPTAQPASSVTLADFQPVQQLEPRIVEKNDGSNDSAK